MITKLSSYLERDLTEEEFQNLLKISKRVWEYVQGKGYLEDVFVEAFSIFFCEEVSHALEGLQTPDGQRYLSNQDEASIDQLNEFQNPLEEEMLEAFQRI